MPEPFKAILSLILIFYALSMVGAWLLRMLRAQNQDPLLHPLAGWALFIVMAIAIGIPNSFGAMGAAVIIFTLAFVFSLKHFSKKNRLDSVVPLSFFAALLVALPLLYAVAETNPHAWDDFSHWLPNAHFLFSQGSFPRPDSAIASSWPAYPYGLSLLIASFGWLQGHFIESAGPLLNIGLLILFSLFLARRFMPEARMGVQLKLFSGLFLALIFLNPGFNEFMAFSSYSDFPTAILLALLVFLGVEMFRKETPRDDAIMFALLAIPFVQLRQANIFLLLILAISLCLAHLPYLKGRMKSVALMLVPASLIALIWQFYASGFQAQQGFTVSASWKLEFLGPLLAAMGETALRKSGYFILLLGTFFWGCWNLRKKPAANLPGTFALLTAGYFMFLTLAYLGSGFSDKELREAASFFRYMSHLNLAGVMVVLFAVAPWFKAKLDNQDFVAGSIGLVFLLAVPVLGIFAMNKHWLPSASLQTKDLRSFAHSIQPYMPEKGRIGMLLPGFDGLEASIIGYQWSLDDRRRTPPPAGRFTRFDAAIDASRTGRFAEQYDVVIVGPDDALAWQSLGEAPQSRWAGFIRNGTKWDMIAPQVRE